jgi:hypothetical protein
MTRYRLYQFYCLVIFIALMAGARWILTTVVYSTPLWLGLSFCGCVVMACLAWGIWMDRKAGRY